MTRDSVRNEIAAGLRATWVGIMVNILLVIVKVWAGVVGRSQALLADGIHSLSDLFSDFVVMLGLKWGRKGEDEDHHFGHARIETISSMIVGILLVATALGLAWNAVVNIQHHEESIPGTVTIVVAFVSIILKEGMYWYTRIVGEKIRSLALLSNAWHHRTDALSSIAVLIGVAAANINPAWSIADSVAAIVVTWFIARVGISLIWNAFREVVDTAPDRKVLDRLSSLASGVDGVRQVHDIRARYSGTQ
ncbi:MAG: cation transporter, partial [candidate division Zixibacteria bacterium]|nr:cation transporter [candidate division Zixibacteria bacterium]